MGTEAREKDIVLIASHLMTLPNRLPKINFSR